MTCMATDKGICALEYETGRRTVMLKERLTRFFPEAVQTGPSSPLISAAQSSIERYFARDAGAFQGLPLDLRGTEFELAVWNGLLRIPWGTSLTYGTLASRIGGNPRAVGSAIGRNPASIIVPCHRVVGHDGGLTGYGGGIANKEWLLQHEGALTPGLALG
jgi:methylated-DNA-[protein]-cysteine S-methyltransferase